MQISVGPSFLRSLSYIALLLLFPFVVTGMWMIAQLLLSFLPAWIVMLGLQFVVGVFILVLLVRQRPMSALASAQHEALVATQEQFQQLYKQSPVPYLTLDRHGEIILANMAAVRLFKTTDGALEGEQFISRLHMSADEDYSVLLGKLRSGISVTDFEIEIEVQPEVKRWVLLSVHLFGPSREQVVSLVDITHQKTVDIAKSEFVALAAHQLRTPISAIRWNVELLKSAETDQTLEVKGKFYEKVERNVMRMINLINDFLSVSKLETGTFATELGEVVLAEFCESVLDEHIQTVTQKKLQVIKNYIPDTFTFQADTRLLHIIVNNLFSNAVKYVPEGASVGLQYEVVGDSITLVVSDTGIGIPAGEIDQLFTKFYRATNARSHKAEGTGLGLYIVKQSVELMGGTVEVRSEENVGTTFTIQIPIAQTSRVQDPVQ